jgi:hypothetical protein
LKIFLSKTNQNDLIIKKRRFELLSEGPAFFSVLIKLSYRLELS